MNRCKDEELFNTTVDLINDLKNYFKSRNQTIYENPSSGKKKGGISTLEDKSLGCTQKSGSARGNYLVASTALAAAGVHIVLFTAGRGTPFASSVLTMPNLKMDESLKK